MHHRRPTDDPARLWSAAARRRFEGGAKAPHSEGYGGAELLASEKVREEKKQATLREFRARFIDGPVLVLPLRKFSFEMNPNEAVPFESFGTIFPTLTLRDEWGTIVVKRGGALISSDWTRLTLPFPLSEDYTLTLDKR